jgi:serine/threonine protein kinase
MADWEGKTLGKVHIEDLIARGGMAEVYTGTHESFGRVAVKVMRGLLEKDSEQLARFQREAEVIEDLRHQNIVQMFEYDVEDESPYLVMEYIPGPSLASYLKILQDKKQRLPIGLVAQILKSIASALDYAHLKGIVHRDIKPANVLLRSQSAAIESNKTLPIDVEPILTDFGLVRLLDSTMHTTAGSVSGTPTYMSPEQARGEKVDKRTDIYSLGIMLYEMLAGVVPFQSDTTFGMLMKHINEPPPPIQGISTELQAVLYRALAKDPTLRYESAGDLADEFLAVFNGQTISPGTLHIAEMARQAAEESGHPAPPPQASRRNRWVRLGIELVAAVALGVVIFRLIILPLTSTAVDPNAPVGRMRFSFSNSDNDKITFSLTGQSPPGENEHFEAWLVHDDGTFRDVGRLAFDASGVGRLEFTDQDGKNLLDGLQQIQITREQNDGSASASTKPAGEVVYSSIFPPQTLVHVRNLGVSFNGGSDNASLIAGLFYYSGSYIEATVNGDPNYPSYIGMVTAYENGDEATIHKRNEEMINMIVGSKSKQYLDYDGDGEFDDMVNGSNGYGSLPNGDQAGYLQQTALEAQSAADAPDSTSNIRQQNQNLQICIQNMKGWTDQILPLALKLQETSFADMKPTIDELSSLGKALSNGVDANENGTVEPVEGECGALQAYDYGTNMADFLILKGTNRIPATPTGK